MGLSCAIIIIGFRAHARYSPMVVVKEMKIIFLLWKPARNTCNRGICSVCHFILLNIN
ncbi:unnamed protein product [Staurois parvus]|uniref:Uncharacterized protein n=1 Tax=Staurois parvus TaxID=386267 RepID=A0ABN9BPS0_9NEOB|nr:unnamed protein product [Staurois parvus]